MTVKVVTDSSACLPPALAAEYGITVLDFHAEGKGDEETTAGLGSLELTACYARLLERGGDDGVVAVHISKELSGTWSSASQAAAVLGETVEVLDTQSAGMVVGQAAIAAARCADEGGSLDECRGAAQQVIDSGHLWLFLGKTDAMARGGRLSAGQRLLSTALAIKPILHLTGGKLELVAKTRTQAKAMDRLVTFASAEYRAVAEATLQADSEAAEADAEASSEEEVVASTSTDEVSVPVGETDTADAAEEADAADASNDDADAEAGSATEEDSEGTSDSEDPDTTDESESDSEGDSDAESEDSEKPARGDRNAQVTVDTEPVYRPRIFSFGKDKGDKGDKAEKSSKADKADKSDKADEAEKTDKAEKTEKHGKADKAGKHDQQTPLEDLPRVPMHLAVHHFEAEEVAEQLRVSLREALPSCVVISVVDVTHAMAVHTGPGAVGVSLVRD
ncbi:MAG TPA: DegV family protein [Candidatus Corynebacterium avicola]|uniref:DegV family protein n=1 Tax=Candidatus Corynebacterium avicola TaxID=2838527 RepID=A0A9D1ULC8_9CORY|nr:DegV family protein [Candidatus Corynebacterium avicola]